MSRKDERLTDDYEPRYDIDYEAGRQGEFFVVDIIEALTSERVEVKTDLMSQETGNVYVEYECLKRGKYVPSGIAVTEAPLWVFVLECGELAVVISTSRLKELAGDAYRNGRKRECKKGSHPTRGVVIPLTMLVKAGRKIGNGDGHQGNPTQGEP